MRLFVALDLDQVIRESVQHFVDSIRPLAPDIRWVQPESLHVTLKFIGAATASKCEEIRGALANIQSVALNISLGGYGFFPNSQEARVVWVGIEPASELARLAGAVDEALEPLGIARETNPFHPHLTLARRKNSGPFRRNKPDIRYSPFERLQKMLAGSKAPEFGTMTAREFFLYESQLSPSGSRYTKIAHFPLH